MIIEILTTWKQKKTKYGYDKRPNLDIKAINGKPFNAEYTYLPSGECIAKIEFN